MDVAKLSGNAIRIKSKNASLVIDPTKETGKTEANCVVKLNNNPNFSDAKIEGSRISITGPGEYEVGGIKIAVLNMDGNLIARIDAESIKLLVGRGEAMEKVQDKVEDSDILVVDANEKFKYSELTSLDPKLVLAYGEMAEELGKSLGKSGSEKTHKFSTTAVKLPSEMQFIHLA